MDKQQILENLNTLKDRLLLDVGTSFENEGLNYGIERLNVWTTKTTSFFKENMPSEVRKLGLVKMSCGQLIRRSFETDFQYYWRAYGEQLDAYLKSLIRVVTDDEYDFTPRNKDVKQVKTMPKAKSNKVFIVHGHDGHVKERTARFIEKLGFEAIILHEQVNKSRTIIEKIEDYSDITDFAIVLYTPDDLGVVKTNADHLQPRARQNVIFEHGFLMGKLGRENVVPLVEGDIELPNDISGIVYVSENWEMKIAQEMQEAGYDVDFNKLLKK
ncbi:TIR domain-containing protein [Shewanella xiamenensis]|uniref:TIR domain-containing protein n=1 Tax=Shewanella xiamenensis TaxID=332186 RepID=UPI0005626A8F|nr:nucleotide-binding protein [Shewanella xiamenensis]